MNYFSSDKFSGRKNKFSGRKTREDWPCRCGAQPTLVRKMMDPARGLTVRMFMCQCGERSWTEDKE
jgi:hypothetical protein